MVIRKSLIYFSCLLLLSLSGQLWAEVQARVDKKIVAQDDTINLTLGINRSGARAPDLAKLEKDFYILGTNQSSRRSYSNGKLQSSTEWFINIIPKHSGQIVIPSFIIEGEQTRTITINVKAAGTNTKNNTQPIFLESTVSKNSLYIQEQLTYTIRILYAVQIENATLPDPILINASLKKIGENSFDKDIKGINYRVFERTYAIFPQQIGELIIPHVVFSALQPSSRQSLYRLQKTGTPVRKISKEHRITVKAPPASFRGNTWLPAKSLKMVESWSKNPRELHVGESITRTITTNAQNLLAAQLPPLEFQSLPGAKLYPDQGSLKSTENNQGVYATRIDSTAIIPTREGKLLLPAIRIRWWDTNSSRSRIALIPETSLTILPALDEPTNIETPRAVDHSVGEITPRPPEHFNFAQINRWLLFASITLLLLWLGTLIAYFRIRSGMAYASLTPPPAKNKQKPLSEKKAFSLLNKACKQKDLLTMRNAIIQWANCYWEDSSFKSLDEIKTHCQHPSLNAALTQLDNALYNDRALGENWNSDTLISVIKLIRSKSKKAEKKEPLAALYKAR